MTDWEQYEILEEEFYKESPQKFKQPKKKKTWEQLQNCLLYTSPSPRDGLLSRMPSSA